MKKMLSNLGDSVLSKEQMKNVKGGIIDHYWACNDNYDQVAYLTVEAAWNHCMSSIACTNCQQFEIPHP